jgi:hypothetical protein
MHVGLGECLANRTERQDAQCEEERPRAGASKMLAWMRDPLSLADCVRFLGVAYYTEVLRLAAFATALRRS